MKKLILIPTALITGLTPIISLVGCNNDNKYQYLVDIDFTHYDLQDNLELTIDLSDWKHSWDNTDIDLSFKCDIAYTGGYTPEPNNQMTVVYIIDTDSKTSYDISEPELAITLTEKTSNIAKTYRFTFLVKIRESKIDSYTFNEIK